MAWIASHGVDRDQCAGKVEAFQQCRNGRDLVRFFIDRFLTQHQPASGGKGGHQMQGLLAGLAIVAAARGLAVDRHQLGLVRPAFGDPRRKAGRKQVRIDPIHHGAQPIGAWDAVVELGEAAQKRQMRFTPIDDVIVVVAARDRPAYHKEQHLAQRIRDLPRLPRILDLRKMIEPQPRLGQQIVHRTLPNQRGPENHAHSAAAKAYRSPSSRKTR
jgi:hypothetical protein